MVLQFTFTFFWVPDYAAAASTLVEWGSVGYLLSTKLVDIHRQLTVGSKFTTWSLRKIPTERAFFLLHELATQSFILIETVIDFIIKNLSMWFLCQHKLTTSKEEKAMSILSIEGTMMPYIYIWHHYCPICEHYIDFICPSFLSPEH